MILPIGDQPNPRGTPVVNYLLIAVNVAVFVGISLPLMMHGPDPSDPGTQELFRSLLRRYPDVDPRALVASINRLSAYDIFLMRWGYRPAQPSIITLFTSMFLHGGWMHLIGNMLFLWIYGDNVEHRLGRLGYLAAYLLTGIAAAVGYGLLMWGSGGNAPMVGASGAISGVLGLYFVWFPRNKVRLLVVLFPFYFDVWLVGARIVLGFFLLIDNLLPYLLGPKGGGGVAHGAHIGGFVAGLTGAYAIDRIVALRRRQRAQADIERGEPEDEPHDAQGVLSACRGGRPEAAARGYLALPRSARMQVPADAVVELGDQLVAGEHPDAALSVFGQAAADRPRGPDLDRMLLGIALVLLYEKRRPTAAYQYLMDALDADPTPEVVTVARQALADISELQKYRVRGR